MRRMMTSLPPDPTLDEIRDALASDIAGNAAFDGWGDDAIIAAANGAGVDIDVARLAFPGGAPDMIDAWFAHVDRAVLAAVPPERLATMNIRGKITALVEARLALLAPNRESLPRAIAILALPRHVIRAGKLGWRSEDPPSVIHALI